MTGTPSRARLGGLLLGLATVPCQAQTPPHGLDAQLQEYRFALRAAIQEDLERFEDLRRGAPRGVITWRGRTFRFPAPPEASPDMETLTRVYPLSALPPSWHGPLNKVGADLFLRGVEDGRRLEVGKPWRRYADTLADRSLERESILSLSEIFPGFNAKEDYTSPPLPFARWEKAATTAREALARIPGGRRGPVQLPDDFPEARPLLNAFHTHEAVARDAGLALRRKTQGLAMRGLIRLQGAVYAQARDFLGHDPRPEDVAKIRQILPDRWIGLLTLHHARQYFAGYNAVTRGQSGTSGAGETEEPFEGEGTGTGKGPPPPLAIEGSGTGSGEPSGTGVGTGDGRVADPDGPTGGSGSGTGSE